MTCDCCDQTADSPDPVVTRLERELAVKDLRIDVLESITNSISDAIRERHVAYADLPLPRRVEAVCDALTDMRRERDEAREQLDAAGDGDTWRAAAKRLEEELEATREQLRQQSKSFCTHCGKLFPSGKEGMAQFRDHITECNKHPLHKMATDNERLRGLLREACEYEIWISHGEREWALSADLRQRAQAALKGKS